MLDIVRIVPYSEALYRYSVYSALTTETDVGTKQDP